MSALQPQRWWPRLQAAWRLWQLRRATRRQRSPRAFLDLTQALLGCGQQLPALQACREGLAHFPQAPELRRLCAALLAQRTVPDHPPTNLRAAGHALLVVSGSRGVRKATLIAGKQALVRGEVDGSADPFLKFVRVIARSSRRFACKLQLGEACDTVVEVGDGQICVCAAGEVLAAAQCDRTARSAVVLQQLRAAVLAVAPVGSQA